MRDQFFLYISSCLPSWKTVLASIHSFSFTHSFIKKCKLNFYMPDTAVGKREMVFILMDLMGLVKEPGMKQVNKGLSI